MYTDMSANDDDNLLRTSVNNIFDSFYPLNKEVLHLPSFWFTPHATKLLVRLGRGVSHIKSIECLLYLAVVVLVPHGVMSIKNTTAGVIAVPFRVTSQKKKKMTRDDVL